MIDSSTDLPNNQTTSQGCPTVLMAESKDSSGVTIVAICMTIMALCAVAYFTLRWYFEERRLRCSAQLCKCGPAARANAVECGDLCRYSEKRAVNVAVQTNPEQQQHNHPATSSCWTTSDVRMSEARRSVCAFSSPMPNNNEAAAPTGRGHWRPPVSGSSTRRKSLQMTSQGRRFYHHHNQQQRRSRTTVPSVKVHSPSSSDSYSILTNNSKMAALNKDLTAVTFSDEEEERILSSQHRNRHLELSYASAFHPRYNTPVSETNEECVSNNERQEEEEGHSSAKEVEEEELRDDEGAVGGSRSMGDGDDAGKLHGTPTANTSANQADLKRYQTTGNLASATAVLSTLMPVDTIRFGPPKGRFPSYETLPGGRFITRWTQTELDNASQAPSLDWDHHYDWERLRSADPVDEALNQFHLGESGSATLLMASHNSETTLHAMSQRSASSPYVLCFSCSGEFNVNEDRRNSTCVGRRTSSPDPRSSTLRQTHHQPYLAPPAPQPNFLTPSPSHPSTSRIPRLCNNNKK